EGVQGLLVSRCFHFLDGLAQTVLCRNEVILLLENELVALLHFSEGLNSGRVDFAEILQSLLHSIALLLQFLNRNIGYPWLIEYIIQVDTKFNIQPFFHSG